MRQLSIDQLTAIIFTMFANEFEQQAELFKNSLSLLLTVSPVFYSFFQPTASGKSEQEQSLQAHKYRT